MTAVLEVEGLRKTYRRVGRAPRKALDGFDMTVEAGQVHGFLGPNGSGKTTTLRTVMGLIRPTGGTIWMFGKPIPRALPRVIGSVGAIVESPQLFPHFTARDTLTLLADAGNVPRARVPEVLELVGLRDRAGDRVKTFSLGMKQRLAVASAVLKHPRLLILDEPANGLDPGGIREMRDLMRRLAESGMTVLLSSHILAEIQQICDAVTIISQGRRVATGSVDEVLAQHSTRSLRIGFEAATDLPTARTLLAQGGYTLAPEAPGRHLVLLDVNRPAEVNRLLTACGLYPDELTPETADLESVFLELTGTAPVAGTNQQVGGESV